MTNQIYYFVNHDRAGLQIILFEKPVAYLSLPNKKYHIENGSKYMHKQLIKGPAIKTYLEPFRK